MQANNSQAAHQALAVVLHLVDVDQMRANNSQAAHQALAAAPHWVDLVLPENRLLH